MDTEKKYLLLPYDTGDYGLIKAMVSQDINVKIASFRGVGLIGKDVSYVCNRRPLDKIIHSFDDIKNDKFDYVIISNSVDKLKEKEIYSVFKKWINVLDSVILYFGEDRNIRKLVPKSQSNVAQEIKKILKLESQLGNTLSKVSAPIVYVGL